MLSRIGESIYWLARFLERAKNVARFLDVHAQLLLEQPWGTLGDGPANETFLPVFSLLGETDEFRAAWPGRPADRAAAVDHLVLDLDRPSSVRSIVRAARENGRAVRDRISREMWEELNTFHHALVGLEAEAVREHPHATLIDICRRIQRIYGVAEATLLHDGGFLLFRTGLFLERAGLTARLLRGRWFKLQAVEFRGLPVEPLGAAILKSASAFEAYRKVHHARMEARRVAEFLLFEPAFPRTVRFCLASVDYAVRGLRRSPPGSSSTIAERATGRALADLAYAEPGRAFKGQFGLDDFLARVLDHCDRIGEAIAESHFLHLPEEMLVDFRSAP